MDPNLLAFIVYLVLALALACAVVLLPLAAEVLRGGATWRRERAAGFGGKFRVPFFLLAAFFVLALMAALMLMPWAVAFRWAVDSGAGSFAIIHLTSFIALVALAMAFALGSGVLDREG